MDFINEVSLLRFELRWVTVEAYNTKAVLSSNSITPTLRADFV